MEELPDWINGWKSLMDEENKRMMESDNEIIIECSRRKGKIYDIDRLFWNNGKLFGYDTYFKDKIDFDGKIEQYGPYTKIKTDDGEYEIFFDWDWEYGFLRIVARAKNNTPLGIVPFVAQKYITFDLLFGIKPYMVGKTIETTIDELITEFKRKGGI